MRRFTTGGFALLAALCVAGFGTHAVDRPAAAWAGGPLVVSYGSPGALARALERHPAAVVRRVPALGLAAVRPAGDAAAYAKLIGREPGILRVESTSPRRSLVEPSLVAAPDGSALQWQYSAIGADRIPAEITHAAAALTIAVIDTGADLSAPDLAAKAPRAWSVRGSRGADVADANGHGTFVAALAAGAGSNGDGIAGVAGDAQLLVVQAGGATGGFTDVDEAAAIVYAVDHGAKILNLSLGGPTTSTAERRAVDYAVSKGALLVAAVGNGQRSGNAVEYPAALLQPVGSRGVGGRGLAVAASTRAGTHASFSSTGTHVSLAAPGEGVFSALSAASSEGRYPRTALPSATGAYGYGSGTSYAAPQVAGAAALVWAAAPQLTAAQVASILEETASGAGAWTPELGFGVIDVAAAVARAQAAPAARPVRIEPASARLSLRAKTSDRSSRRVALDARLQVDGRPAAVARRTVILESFDGARWKRAATAVTDARGRAVWRYALERGTYRVRARYRGTEQVAAATSAAVRVSVG